MATLLAKVADEQALFLKHDLELLKLALFLAQAIVRKLERSIGLTRRRLHIAPGSLKAAQFINSKNLRKLVGSIGKVAVLPRSINLTLKGAQLAGNLAIDIASTLEMLIHGSNLFERALLATLVFGNAGRLFNQSAALLRTALQDGVEFSLADDGMSIFAQPGIMQDILDVHKPAGARINQILRLARTIHAPRNSDLVKVDRKHMVRIIQNKSDLRHANGFARRRAGENDIFHGLAAQLLGTLFAQNPKDSV